MSGGVGGGAWRRVRGPTLAVVLLAVLLLAVEGLLRLLGLGAAPADVLRLPGQPIAEKEVTLWDPDLYYRLRPSTAIFSRYHVNRHGVRGPEYEITKPSGTLRLLCAGDSSTFGLGVVDGETWPACLQRILGGLLEGSVRVEAINFGVPGYSTEQTKRQILRDGLPLAPDAIVVCPTAQNDASWRSTGGDAVVLAENSAVRMRLDQWHLARLLRLGSVTESFHADAIRDPGTPGSRARVTPPEFAANLTAIIEAGRGVGAPVMLIVTDHNPDLEAAVPGLAASEELSAQVAEQHGARSVDSRGDFALYAPYPMFSDRIHFVPLGQQLIARKVVLGLLDAPPLIDVGPRAAFVAAWRAAQVEGVAAHAAALRGGDRPPRFAELLLAIEQPAQGSPEARAAIEQHDPIGLQASAYNEGRLWMERGLQSTDAATRDAIDARLEEIRRHVHPADPFPTLVGGPRRLLDTADFGQVDKAALNLARAVAVFDAVIGAAPPRRDSRLAQAIAARKSNDPLTALALLDAVLKLNDACSEAYYERAQCLRKAGRRPDSLPDLQRVIELEPESALGQYVSAMLAFEQGRPADAEPLFRRAIELDPTMGRARFGLARILIDRGRLDEAEQQLSLAAIIITDPVDVRPLMLEIEARRAGAAAPADG